MRLLKNIVKTILKGCMRIISKTKAGRMVNEIIIEDVMNRVADVAHNNISMKFAVPNALNHFRVDTFSTKEPETLDWIDTFPKESVFWDVGGNVGLYSIYAAKKKQCKVYCFEPSVFNLELLARNIFLNNVQKLVCIMPIPLSDKMGISQMQLSNTEWGGALSTFGKNIDSSGNSFKDVFSYQTFGISADQVVSNLNLPQPNFIKIDVDGIEHFILSGANKILNSVSGVLVEINDDFNEQADLSKRIMQNAGFKFIDKFKSEFVSVEFENTYNQIWERNTHG